MLQWPGGPLYRVGHECSSPGLNMPPPRGQRTLPPSSSASMGLEVVFRLRANVVMWHCDSATNKDVGMKPVDSLGNRSIKEAVKRVIRQIK